MCLTSFQKLWIHISADMKNMFRRFETYCNDVWQYVWRYSKSSFRCFLHYFQNIWKALFQDIGNIFLKNFINMFSRFDKYRSGISKISFRMFLNIFQDIEDNFQDIQKYTLINISYSCSLFLELFYNNSLPHACYRVILRNLILRAFRSLLLR